jgi:diguanylate cyclase (GGDEF)-like protein
VDRFKGFNDSYGHAAGDQVLRQVAAALCETVRATDLCFRMGGDEFLVLLPHQGVTEAGAWAERFRAEVGQLAFVHGGARMGVTVSVGLAEAKEGTGMPDRLLDAADAAMYAAKRGGRDGVRRSE